MKKEIIADLINNEGETEERAKTFYEDLSRHGDIIDEYYSCVKNNHTIPTKSETTVSVKGYSASDIASRFPSLNAGGVYTYLVQLREDTEFAKHTGL